MRDVIDQRAVLEGHQKIVGDGRQFDANLLLFENLEIAVCRYPLWIDGKSHRFLKIGVPDDGIRVEGGEFLVGRHVQHDIADAAAGQRPLPDVGAQIVAQILALHSEDQFSLDAQRLRQRLANFNIDAF